MALADNPLHISWHDSAWIPHLNPTNVLEYFCERSNPFYDRTCNNEIVKMQRLNPEQLQTMTGLEFVLLHVQEPILYVVRKQIRQANNQVTPQADYYILAGVVYQAPDLNTVIQSRVLNCVHSLQSAFQEFQDIKRFQSSSGYTWTFKEKQAKKAINPEASNARLDEPFTKFHAEKVDSLLRMLEPPPT